MKENMIAAANAERAKRLILELAKRRQLLDAIAEAFLKIHNVQDNARLAESRRHIQSVFDGVVQDFRRRSALVACIKHAHALWGYSDGLHALKRSFPVDIPTDEALRAFDALYHAAEKRDTHSDQNRGIVLLTIFLEEDDI